MSATPTGDFPCPYCGRFGPHFGCHPLTYYASPLPPLAAGHCGKCGAPYTSTVGSAFEPLKFNPSCKCWNL